MNLKNLILSRKSQYRSCLPRPHLKSPVSSPTNQPVCRQAKIRNLSGIAAQYNLFKTNAHCFVLRFYWILSVLPKNSWDCLEDVCFFFVDSFEDLFSRSNIIVWKVVRWVEERSQWIKFLAYFWRMALSTGAKQSRAAMATLWSSSWSPNPTRFIVCLTKSP